MRLEKAYVISVISLIVLGVSLAIARAQTPQDQITVNLPYRVTVESKVLEPGEYQIRQVSDNLVRISKMGSEQMKVEAPGAQLLHTFAEPAKETKVILSKAGDKYYFDQIWVQGKGYRYKFIQQKGNNIEFVMPENPKPEDALSLSAKYEQITATPTVAETKPAR